MRLKIRDITEKVNEINRVIDALDKMPEHEDCTIALRFLEEYTNMLLDIKVEVDI